MVFVKVMMSATSLRSDETHRDYLECTQFRLARIGKKRRLVHEKDSHLPSRSKLAASARRPICGLTPLQIECTDRSDRRSERNAAGGANSNEVAAGSAPHLAVTG